ncbi:ketopantoate hydroxymethyltransferase [Coniophora puteana RWD-64-598 SS2]|uniref:3-methyl-2-oxobutanoate hydroxymethyltransferase n=1 Tax=Coniophora puteana (strain RWD-64-598) TaxID=741705 RepID=A0A5M3MNH4_CONPW|nr:ketopantoate hydroxymethyltransferase [Coniophora puteana RWD-64-598 SS2]EIW80570.1 ketopantoate hydroxymethyltransferase [Coniophora puteana RWD-64-598 SS2]
MSVRPLVKETTPTGTGSLPTARKKVTIQSLHKQRASGIPITVMTAYDFPTARACDTHGVDITLVGDSLAQVCLGYDSTTRLTLPEMIHHCRAVARGTAAPFLVADMPFGSYFEGPKETMAAAVRMLQEGHVEGVKIEGGIEIVDSVRALTRIGIPVMAHVGLMPQRHTALSGYRVQGRTAQGAREILQAALALEDAGAFSMVLEAIPHELGAYITSRLKIPTIGIGAGPGTSGQVLVYDDVMATWLGHKAKFVRRFADVKGEVKKGITSYVDAVKDGSFPSVAEESYHMDPEQFNQFLEMMDDQSWVLRSSKAE